METRSCCESSRLDDFVDLLEIDTIWSLEDRYLLNLKAPSRYGAADMEALRGQCLAAHKDWLLKRGDAVDLEVRV